jgi:hypothetical protein
MLAKRVLTAPFGERALRHAVFARLTALHEHAAALPRNRGTADACAAAQRGQDLLRAALVRPEPAPSPLPRAQGLRVRADEPPGRARRRRPSSGCVRRRRKWPSSRRSACRRPRPRADRHGCGRAGGRADPSQFDWITVLLAVITADDDTPRYARYAVDREALGKKSVFVSADGTARAAWRHPHKNKPPAHLLPALSPPSAMTLGLKVCNIDQHTVFEQQHKQHAPAPLTTLQPPCAP